MSSIEFPYIVHKNKAVPIIPLEIKYKNKWWQVNAYVDSGAFYSIFGGEVADLLEISLTSGIRRMAIVGDGSFIPFYMHKVKLRIGDKEIAMPVGFSEKLGVGFNVLGLDIFNHYLITFNNRSRLVTFDSFKKSK